MRFDCILWSALAAAPVHAAPSLKEAAVLYHQGLYDSALSELEGCRAGPLKRKDSLALFQYSGMAEARLGRERNAADHFRALLALDSLFQFPRNEDSSVLSAFAQARQSGAGIPSGLQAGRDTLAADLPSARIVPAALDTRAPFSLQPIAPAPDPSPGSRPQGIGLALGAVPFGGGWLARGDYKHGFALAFLQAGGMALSLYASARITAIHSDPLAVEEREEGSARGWQLAQRVSLSTALGAYLFSLIASKRK